MSEGRNAITEMATLRHQLLDVSLKNNLLNNRILPSRTVRIIDTSLSSIYENLVFKGKTLKIDSFKKASDKKTGLIAADEPEALEKKLIYLNNQAKGIFEDQGYPVLYLAVGFLQWYDNDSQKAPLSPILLIPVEMKRTGKVKTFHLTWTGEEIYTSLTLQAKLRDYNVFLPDFPIVEDMQTFNDYFKQISEAVKGKEGWKVKPEIRLDLFNFKKFVMYKDLDPVLWDEKTLEKNHPLMVNIFGDSRLKFTEGIKPEEVDSRIQAHNSYCVLDADSSQLAVIEDAKLGRSMVIEGPPGTGKSQTIVNCIAELMAQGKKVLFISEKMAALEVVKNRLANAGLGEMCLELHSDKTKKGVVLESIEKNLNNRALKPVNADVELCYIFHEKKALNEYARIQREPIGNVYGSFYEMFGVRERIQAYFTAKALKMPRYRLVNPETWTIEDMRESKFTLGKLGELAPVIVPMQNNAWYGCSPALVLPVELPEIEADIEKCCSDLKVMDEVFNILNELTFIKKPKTFKELADVKFIVDAIIELNKLSLDITKDSIWTYDWALDGSQLAVETLIECQKNKYLVDSLFKPEVMSIEHDERARFTELSKKRFKILNKEYKKLRNKITSYYRVDKTRTDEEIYEDLKRVVKCNNSLYSFNENEKAHKAYFGDFWKGIDSDANKLLEIISSFRTITIAIKLNKFSGNVFTLFETEMDIPKIQGALNLAKVKSKNFVQHLNTVEKRIKPDFKLLFEGIENANFEKLHSHMLKWRTEINSLVFWSQYINYRKTALQTKAAYLIEDFESGKLDPADLLNIFEGNYVETLIIQGFMLHPELHKFVRELHEGEIEKFKNDDRKLLELNRKRVYNKVKEKTNAAVMNLENASAMATLQAEFNKKRRHISIRSLICKSGKLIQEIKPCFMMSPLSVAQYIDPRGISFDVIIFDEASQIKPEDAVGSLLRGKQVIVMGDSKQLPPTDFFETVVNMEIDDLDSNYSGDMESLLSLCKRVFPTKTLQWHYRSRHESLIAISNKEFYGNQLQVYPSPIQRDNSLGLKFVHLPNSIYERGTSGVNREEAKAVACAVFNHYATNPEKSLGVGTFNIKQQAAILEEIEILSAKYPNIALGNENESFFVKNLETIQGDERDVILLSVGFGFDQNKKLSQNFGALNQTGGERRLNVLVTRAREKCVIYANFRGQDLSLDASASVGVRALKAFLEFAENGKLGMNYNKSETDESFVDFVRKFLIEQGYEVHKNVGGSAYKLNLAIPDPEDSGRYLLGIECDGETYFNSRVCRDRDRLREQILTGLGWKLTRVWSTDWYLHPEQSKKILLEIVRNAVGYPMMKNEINNEVIQEI